MRIRGEARLAHALAVGGVRSGPFARGPGFSGACEITFSEAAFGERLPISTVPRIAVSGGLPGNLSSALAADQAAASSAAQAALANYQQAAALKAEVDQQLQVAEQQDAAAAQWLAKAQAVVIGSVDVPTVSAFMQAFEQAHYTPKVIIATAGPDQGAAFIKAVGAGNAHGMMVPNSWFGGSKNPASQKMVKEYIKQYGGTAAGVNADIAEAYSVGQVMAAAVKATGGFNNAKIISYLHSGVTIQSVQGGVKFNSVGENLAQTAYTFQWQKGGTTFVEVNPVGDKGAVKVLYPKPAWGK